MRAHDEKKGDEMTFACIVNGPKLTIVTKQD